MTELTAASRTASAAAPSGARLGDRLRLLRVAAGLTQTELAGERFSKEYVSQIERGKTRPTQETIDWLAARLGTDAGYLASGVSSDERGRVEAALARADALTLAYRTDEALVEYETVSRVVPRSIWLTYSLEKRWPASSFWVRPAATRSWRRRSPRRVPLA